MTHQIILLVLVAFLLVLPFIYKKAGRRWTRFYLNMAMSEQHRKTFILVMAILILSVNFLQYRIYGPRLWLIPGFIAGLLALKYKWTDAVMRWIHKDRMLQFFALAFFFLVSMDARLFTFAVAFALTIDFSFFYPSERIIKMAESDNGTLLSMSNEEIRNIYF